MKKLRAQKTLVSIMILLALVSPLFLFRSANAQPVLPTIFIQPDGSIYPDTAPIQRNGNIYTFTDNVYSAVKILKSNIVLDGAGYTIKGPFDGNSTDIWVIGTGPDPNTLDKYTIGVDLGNKSVTGITIDNLNVQNFSIGMYIWTQNNTVTRNTVSDNIVGLLISGSNATLSRNHISDNMRGVFMGFNTGVTPNDILVFQNDFENNKVQLSGCQCKTYNMSEPPHNWDNGKQGNYWSDYNGTDTNHDGIGDTPYAIDVLDRDRFPLMQSPIKSSAQISIITAEAIVLGISLSAVLLAAVFTVKRMRKRKIS
jgi:Periplasmic copper-binding protein (NosD)